jgi:hypothetical protein
MIFWHCMVIGIIIFLLYLALASFFTDLPKKLWEYGVWINFGMLPKDLPSYIKAYRRLVVTLLLSMIAVYVLIITGVIK